jgi:hypothetical protein
MYKLMNTLSKLTMYPLQMLAIRIGLTKASTIIPVAKQNHIISGLKSLFSIQITPTSSCQNQTLPHDRASDTSAEQRGQ